MAGQQSDLVEMAIQQAMQLNEDYREGDFLVDWVSLAFVDNPDKSKRGGYLRFVSNGNIPHYRIIGLLQQAIFELQLESLGGNEEE